MGTRHLIVVYKDGQHKIAQYGQWDGYPSGQGSTALAFCRDNLTTYEGRSAFASKLARCRFATQEDRDAALTRAGIPKGKASWTSAESQRFREQLPTFNRDLGATILDLVATAPDGPILLRDEIAFAADSLMCEWAWVIDLDALTFEGYRGGNEKPVPDGERFASMPVERPAHRQTTIYYPVTLWGRWSLDALPSAKDFLAHRQKEEE